MEHIDKKVITVSSFFLLTGVFAYLSHCSQQNERQPDVPIRHSWYSIFTGRVFTSQLANAYNSLFGNNTWIQSLTNEVYQHTHKFVLFSTDESSTVSTLRTNTTPANTTGGSSKGNRVSITKQRNNRSPSVYASLAHQRRSINVHHRRQSPGIFNLQGGNQYISHLPYIPDEYQLSNNLDQSASQHPVFYHEYLLPLADSPTSLAPDPNKIQPIPQYLGHLSPTPTSSTFSNASCPVSSHQYLIHTSSSHHLQSPYPNHPSSNLLPYPSYPSNTPSQYPYPQQQPLTSTSPLAVTTHKNNTTGNSKGQGINNYPNNPAQYESGLPSPNSDYISDLASLYGADDTKTTASNHTYNGVDTRHGSGPIDSSFDLGSHSHLLGVYSQPPTPQKTPQKSFNTRPNGYLNDTSLVYDLGSQNGGNGNDTNPNYPAQPSSQHTINPYSTPQHTSMPYPSVFPAQHPSSLSKLHNNFNTLQPSHPHHTPHLLNNQHAAPHNHNHHPNLHNQPLPSNSDLHHNHIHNPINLGLSGISTDSTSRRRSNSISVSPGIPLIQQASQSASTTIRPTPSNTSENNEVVDPSGFVPSADKSLHSGMTTAYSGATDSPLTTNSRPATTIHPPHHSLSNFDAKATLSARNVTISPPSGQNSQNGKIADHFTPVSLNGVSYISPSSTQDQHQQTYNTPNKSNQQRTLQNTPYSTSMTPSQQPISSAVKPLPQPTKPLTAAERLNGFGTGYRGNVDMSLFND